MAYQVNWGNNFASEKEFVVFATASYLAGSNPLKVSFFKFAGDEQRS